MPETYWLEEYRKKAVLADPIAQSGRGTQFRAVEFLHVVRQVVDLLGLTRDHDLVDVGCGNGLCDIVLSACCRRLLAVEPVAELVERARANVADCANVEVRLGHAGAIPAERGSVDRALLLGVLQLMGPDEARQALAELRRVLRPRGRAVLASVPDARVKHDVLGPYLDGVRRATHLSESEKDEILTRNLSAQWYDPAELAAWWREGGGTSQVQPLGPGDPNAGQRFHLVLSVESGS